MLFLLVLLIYSPIISVVTGGKLDSPHNAKSESIKSVPMKPRIIQRKEILGSCLDSQGLDFEEFPASFHRVALTLYADTITSHSTNLARRIVDIVHGATLAQANSYIAMLNSWTNVPLNLHRLLLRYNMLGDTASNAAYLWDDITMRIPTLAIESSCAEMVRWYEMAILLQVGHDATLLDVATDNLKNKVHLPIGTDSWRVALYARRQVNMYLANRIMIHHPSVVEEAIPQVSASFWKVPVTTAIIKRTPIISSDLLSEVTVPVLMTSVLPEFQISHEEHVSVLEFLLSLSDEELGDGRQAYAKLMGFMPGFQMSLIDFERYMQTWHNYAEVPASFHDFLLAYNARQIVATAYWLDEVYSRAFSRRLLKNRMMSTPGVEAILRWYSAVILANSGDTLGSLELEIHGPMVRLGSSIKPLLRTELVTLLSRRYKLAFVIRPKYLVYQSTNSGAVESNPAIETILLNSYITHPEMSLEDRWLQYYSTSQPRIGTAWTWYGAAEKVWRKLHVPVQLYRGLADMHLHYTQGPVSLVTLIGIVSATAPKYMSFLGDVTDWYRAVFSDRVGSVFSGPRDLQMVRREIDGSIGEFVRPRGAILEELIAYR